MTDMMFKNRKANIKELIDFGFALKDNAYVYVTNLVDGQMSLTVTVTEDGCVETRVLDKDLGEEYTLHRITGAVGSFVGQVRAEYKAVLKEISAKCFEPDVFKFEQTKAIIDHIRDKYGDELEYLWQRFPDNAIVRRQDNRKWYAVFITVQKRKLGFESDGSVEVIDLRTAPEDIEKYVDGVKILPGYHMNKKHWITICLDGSVQIEEILKKINESYILAGKK